jgi:hypothetical protein
MEQGCVKEFTDGAAFFVQKTIPEMERPNVA